MILKYIKLPSKKCPGELIIMSKNDKNKDEKGIKEKKRFKKKSPDLVMMREDDLREVVTETITKLMAEDVLDMDDDGIIDLKEEVELKKKIKKKEK
jgi:hypothetical protein